MSLQVWLPLNGTLDNLGLDDITFTQTTVSSYENEGKLGMSLQVLDSYIAFSSPALTDASIFSVAFWYKAISDSTITTNWNRVLSFDTKNSDGTTGSLFRFESSYGSAFTSLYALSVATSTSEAIGSSGRPIIHPKDEWHHACFTHTPEENKTYLDGVLKYTDTGAAGTIDGTVRISDKSSGTDPKGRMNDLRIYDHCLSTKEVKELSKGLIYHWPLNDGILDLGDNKIYNTSGYGGYGTITGSFETVSDSPRYSTAIKVTDGLTNYAIAIVSPASDSITISIWVKTSGTVPTGDYHMVVNINQGFYEFTIPTDGYFRQGFYVNGTRYVGNYGSAGQLTDQKWHHLAATYDGTTIKRYIDGVLVNSTSVTGALDGGRNQALYIGRMGTSITYASKDLLESDLRIYATALSEEDIKELYEVSASVDKNGNFWGYELSET